MKANNIPFSQEELCSMLSYCPETGIVRWKAGSPKNKRIGKTAGLIQPNGYYRIMIAGRSYMLHRIIWIMHYGSISDLQIDHINGIRSDNRLENLRQVSNRDNHNNKRAHMAGKLCGATKRPDELYWHARIRIGEKRYYFGKFATEQEAHEEYLKQKAKVMGEEGE